MQRFSERGLWIYENCQWPLTLEAFERLHPGALAAPARRFRMDLQPSSSGLQALGDALSHPLSVLQRLRPGESRIENVSFFTHIDAQVPLEVAFEYRSEAGDCSAHVTLARDDAYPRRAGLALNGLEARRVVEPESYRLSFSSADRTVPLDDPLTLLIADFVRCLDSGSESERNDHARQIVQRMELFETLIAAYSREEGP